MKGTRQAAESSRWPRSCEGLNKSKVMKTHDGFVHITLKKNVGASQSFSVSSVFVQTFVVETQQNAGKAYQLWLWQPAEPQHEHDFFFFAFNPKKIHFPVGFFFTDVFVKYTENKFLFVVL